MMEVLYLLVPIGIVFILIAIKFLHWAIFSGQFDNLDVESQRILFDDSKTLQKNKAENFPLNSDAD